jgi:CubicO group peptidase (beta-lactamase class C family)
MISSAFRRGQFARLWFGFVCLLGVPAATLAQNPASYNGIQKDAFMRRWLVLGAIPIASESASKPDEESQKKIFSTDWLAPHGGEAGIVPSLSAELTISGKPYLWQAVESSGDPVSLESLYGKPNYVVAYAASEIVMPEAASVLLTLGSDDGVKVWLNGEKVHDRWVLRGVEKDSDLVRVKLKKGTNRLLLKVQNAEEGWGFICRFPGEQVLEEKVVDYSSKGDLTSLKNIEEQGMNLNAKPKYGLTALQAARVHGYEDVSQWLVSKGADATAPMPPREQIVDALFKEAVKGRSPGAAVLVAQKGRVVFKQAYGYANLEDLVPVTTETKFRIGSITKQFTAAAILRLQEQGKLSVRDPLSKFIPDYPRGSEVTLHHLLTHTSGIHSYTSKHNFMETASAYVTPEDLIKSFKNDPYDFDPGKKWLYNNSGYFLLGYIIEKVSGLFYGDYLEREFFDPLGMKNTGLHHWSEILEHEARGYAFESGRLTKAQNWDMSRAGGAGALYSTVDDLYLWNEALFAGKVLGAESLKAAFTPVNTGIAEMGPEEGYGYGWGVASVRGLKEVQHGGGLHGFLSHLKRLREEQFTVVVLANSSPPPPDLDPGWLAQEIAQIYFYEKMEKKPTPLSSLSEATLEAYMGRYDYGAAVLTVTREGSRLFAQLSGQPRFEIFPKSESEFLWKVVDARVQFVRDEKGQVAKAIHQQGGQTIQAPKMKDPSVAAVDPAAFDAYVGKYDYGQGKAILTVTREGNRLFAQMTGQPKFEIFPSSATEFFWKVVNAKIAFVKNAGGKVTKANHEQGGQKLEVPKIE